MPRELGEVPAVVVIGEGLDVLLGQPLVGGSQVTVLFVGRQTTGVEPDLGRAALVDPHEAAEAGVLERHDPQLRPQAMGGVGGDAEEEGAGQRRHALDQVVAQVGREVEVDRKRHHQRGRGGTRRPCWLQ